MKKIIAVLFVISSVVGACHEKKKQKTSGDEVSIIPAIPYIHDQVRGVDTSLYGIKKIEFTDTLAADTVFIRREDFRQYAKDFLELPDISSDKLKESYTSAKNFYQDLNLVSFLITPVKDPVSGIIKEEVLITPEGGGSRMYKIIIDQEIITKDSSVIKNMIWAVNDYFQVVTRKQLPGKPETTHTLKVTWTDFTKENDN